MSVRSPAPRVLHERIAVAPTAPRASAPGATSLTDPTSAHPCPALGYPQRQRGQEGRKAGCPVAAGARAGATQAGTRPGCGRGSGVGPVQLPTVLRAVSEASPRDRGGRKRKCRLGARVRRVSLHRCPEAPGTSHGLLHGELEPARGICLLPVRRPALPPTAWLTRLARRLESRGGAGSARPCRSGLWGPPLASFPPLSAT